MIIQIDTQGHTVARITVAARLTQGALSVTAHSTWFPKSDHQSGRQHTVLEMGFFQCSTATSTNSYAVERCSFEGAQATDNLVPSLGRQDNSRLIPELEQLAIPPLTVGHKYATIDNFPIRHRLQTMTRFEAQCPHPVRRPEASRRRSRRVARGSPREIRVVSGKGDPGRSIHPLRVRRPDDEMWVVFYRAPDYRTEKNHEKLTCRA